MRKEKNELLMLLGGLAMFILGLFLLSQKVIVSTSFYYLLGFRMNPGIIMIPFIIGIVWLFATGSLGSKILTGLGAAFIIFSIILSVSVRLIDMTLFDWVVLLVLIFGGLGLMIRVLFAADPTHNSPKSRSKSVEDEIDELRKKY